MPSAATSSSVAWNGRDEHLGGFGLGGQRGVGAVADRAHARHVGERGDPGRVRHEDVHGFRRYSPAAHPPVPSLLVWWVAAEGVVALLAVLLLAGCASFPDGGPHDWRDKIEGVGELGGPPAAARPPTQEPPPPPDPAESGAPRAPSGCVDPDPQVVATCLAPVGAIAVLPDGLSALVGERATGRVLRVRQGAPAVLVTTIPVDATGGGGLTGLVLSPAYAEDQLVYAYITTPTDNRVVKLAAGEPPKPVFVGIPRGAAAQRGRAGGRRRRAAARRDRRRG